MKTFQIIKHGDPILENHCKYASIPKQTLIDSMFQTAYANSGVGLAAPQIGIDQSLAVIDISSGEDPAQKLVLLNPVIIAAEGEQTIQEGCLSLPGFKAMVTRYEHVVVRAMGMDGQWFDKYANGYLAQAIQHEVEHLSGLLYIHKLSPLKRDLVLRRVRKLKKSEEW